MRILDKAPYTSGPMSIDSVELLGDVTKAAFATRKFQKGETFPCQCLDPFRAIVHAVLVL